MEQNLAICQPTRLIRLESVYYQSVGLTRSEMMEEDPTRFVGPTLKFVGARSCRFEGVLILTMIEIRVAIGKLQASVSGYETSRSTTLLKYRMVMVVEVLYVRDMTLRE